MAVAKRFKIQDPDHRAELGNLTGTYTVDWDAGVTIYRVQARRVSGAFQIDPIVKGNENVGTPDRYYLTTLDADNPYAYVHYGIRDSSRYWAEHTDRPEINGITLSGSAVVNLGNLRTRRLSSWHVACGRGRYATSVPKATHEKAAHVVDCLLRHWLLTPHNYALRLTACRREAKDVAGSAAKDVEWANGLLEEARRQLARAERLAAHAAAHAAAPPAGPPAPAEPPRPSTGRQAVASGYLRTRPPRELP